METSRFVEITGKELIEFVEEQENSNTKRKTAYDIELFNNFIQTSNPAFLGSTSLHELTPQVLYGHRNSSLGLEEKMAPTVNPQD